MIFTEALGLLSCSPHPIPAFFLFSILKLFLLESSRKWLKTQKANETWKFMKLRSWNSQDSGSPESQKVYKTFIQRCVKSAKQPGELSCLYSWCATACKLDRDVAFVSYYPWCFGFYSCPWVIHAQNSSLTYACVTPAVPLIQEAERGWGHIFGPLCCSVYGWWVFAKTSSSTKCYNVLQWNLTFGFQHNLPSG